jgi:tetratricopeptide (TPR) repeat protein
LTAEPDALRRAQRLADIRERREPVSYARALEQVLGAGEDSAELWLELGRARMAGGDLAGAADSFDHVVARGPGTPGYEEALREVEASHLRNGDDRAIAADHARRAEAAGDRVTRSREWLASAQSLERAGASADEVRRALKSACEADPDEGPPWKALAALEARNGELLAAAHAHLAAALRSEGAEAEASALSAAQVFEDAGREPDAQRAWAAAAHARPGSWHAQRKLAEAAARKGENGAALEHLLAVSREDVPEGDQTEYQRALAHALEAAARAAEALPHWREVLSREPSDAEAFRRLSDLLRTEGRLPEWLDLASRHEAAIASDIERRLSLRCERARVFSVLGHHEAAAGAWRAALELDPDNPEALAGLAALSAGAAAEAPSEPGEAPAPPSGPAAAEPTSPGAPDMGYAAVGEPTPLEAGLAAIAPEASAEAPAPPSPLEAARRAAGEQPESAAAQDAWAELATAAGAAEESVEAWQAALRASAPGEPAEAARRGRALARALEELGRIEEAVAALERARDAAPWDEAVEADLSRLLLSSARALAGAGQMEAAYARLKLARQLDPGHAELTLSLARIAEKLGHLEEAVALGEAHADFVATADPAGAAARYRELAETLRDRLSDPERAVVLLEKAVSLAAHDEVAAASLKELLVVRRERAIQSLGSQLEAARRQPADLDALGNVSALAHELGAREPDARTRASLLERAAVAESLARFFQPGSPAPPLPSLATRIPPEVRSRVAVPGSESPVGRLLSILAPYLEPLFPVDLSRYGVGPGDRIGAGNAPALQAMVESASRALSARPTVVFQSRRPGVFAAVENTQPPSLVVGADTPSLPQGALAFLLARSLALAGAGWTLLGKFAPRDVLILCELASRFAGGEPPSLGLPSQRAGAFLSAMERTVPAAARSWVGPLGPASAEELRQGFDPAAFRVALERSAERVALLHAGDPHGALTVLSRLERGAEAAPAPASTQDRPEQLDLARFALSDLYLELRGMLLAW